MRNYNYKCIVARNGNKQYYKSVGGKWKRVSNAVGMKAEKGKRKYGNIPHFMKPTAAWEAKRRGKSATSQSQGKATTIPLQDRIKKEITIALETVSSINSIALKFDGQQDVVGDDLAKIKGLLNNTEKRKNVISGLIEELEQEQQKLEKERPTTAVGDELYILNQRIEEIKNTINHFNNFVNYLNNFKQQFPEKEPIKKTDLFKFVRSN